MIFKLGNDRTFPSVKNVLNKEDILYVRHVKHAARGPHVVCGPHDNPNVTHTALGGPSVWHACLSRLWCHAAAWLLGLWDRIPLRAWMFVSCVCCKVLQVAASETSWSLVQMSHGGWVFLIVSVLRTSTISELRPSWAVALHNIYTYNALDLNLISRTHKYNECTVYAFKNIKSNKLC
jgi:hypothetical protein